MRLMLDHHQQPAPPSRLSIVLAHGSVALGLWLTATTALLILFAILMRNDSDPDVQLEGSGLLAVIFPIFIAGVGLLAGGLTRFVSAGAFRGCYGWALGIGLSPFVLLTLLALWLGLIGISVSDAFSAFFTLILLSPLIVFAAGGSCPLHKNAQWRWPF